MIGLIEIKDMEFYAHHGHFALEQKVGTRFSVDVVVKADFSDAANSDNLDDAINYMALYHTIKEEMEGESVALIEKLNKQIIDRIYRDYSGIEEVRLSIYKTAPPMGGKIGKVGITLTL
ncbi:MAG: dihydroneopterin aldolase [Bacteroidales bacterium]